MELVGHRTHACAQARHGDRIGRCRQFGGRRRFKQDDAGTGGAGLLDKAQAMRAETGDGDESIAGTHGAAVQHQAGQNGVVPCKDNVRKQLRKQHRRTHCVPPVAGGVWACALGSAASNSAAASTGSAVSAGGAGRIEAE